MQSLPPEFPFGVENLTLSRRKPNGSIRSHKENSNCPVRVVCGTSTTNSNSFTITTTLTLLTTLTI